MQSNMIVTMCEESYDVMSDFNADLRLRRTMTVPSPTMTGANGKSIGKSNRICPPGRIRSDAGANSPRRSWGTVLRLNGLSARVERNVQLVQLIEDVLQPRRMR